MLTVRTVKVMQDGQLRVVYSSAQPISLSISPPHLVARRKVNPIISLAATANPVGGTGPYSYLWTLDSYGGPEVPVIRSPTFASTQFSMGSVFEEFPGVANFRCTLTDSLGNTAAATIEVNFFFYTDDHASPL